MAKSPLPFLFRRLIRDEDVSDAALLRRFAAERDEAAFTEVMRRHAGMVFGVCRRVLGHAADAEDAFQATFLLLATRHASIRHGASAAGFLHAVAHRVALNARRSRMRRQTHEQSPPTPVAVAAPPVAASLAELQAILDEELARLPERYRTVFVLCVLEDRSRPDVASELGCREGTVSSRLARAKETLQKRLAKRGVALAAVLTATSLSEGAPRALIESTARLAALLVAGGESAAALSPSVAALLHGVTTMSLSRTIGAALVAVAVLTAGTIALAAGSPEPADPPPATADKPPMRPADEPRAADPTLLFTEMAVKPGDMSSGTLRLTRQSFRDGKPTERVELFVGDSSEFGYQSRHRVISDRFVVLGTGTVVDALTKKAVIRPRGTMRVVENGKVFFSLANETKDDGIYSYDPATGTREKVAALGAGRWGLLGALSPDGTRAMTRVLKPVAQPQGMETPYTLIVHQVGREKRALGEFACTIGATGAGWADDKPPGVWLDNTRFLTQSTLGKVVIVDTDSGKTEKLVDLTLTHKIGEKSWETIGATGFTPLGFQQPRFTRLPDGRVLYDADVAYMIDPVKKTGEGLMCRPLGHGFEMSAIPDKITDFDRYTKRVTVTLRHNGKKIGTSENAWWTTPEKPTVVTTDGHLAIVERITEPGVLPGLPAVRVWTAKTGEWTTLGGWADSVIGWVR